MAVLQVIVVARPVKIGRHHRQVLGAVLAVVAPAHFDAGDLGERVGPVGGLQRAGEQAVFAHRLRRHLRVDATGSEEHEACDAVLPRAMDHVGLDGQVVADELRRVAVVGDDAAHLGRGQEYVFRPVLGKEGVCRCGVGQIEFGVGALKDVRVALGFQVTDDGRTDQAAVAGDVDARFKIQDSRVLWVSRFCRTNEGIQHARDFFSLLQPCFPDLSIDIADVHAYIYLRAQFAGGAFGIAEELRCFLV